MLPQKQRVCNSQEWNVNADDIIRYRLQGLREDRFCLRKGISVQLAFGWLLGFGNLSFLYFPSQFAFLKAYVVPMVADRQHLKQALGLARAAAIFEGYECIHQC